MADPGDSPVGWTDSPLRLDEWTALLDGVCSAMAEVETPGALSVAAARDEYDTALAKVQDTIDAARRVLRGARQLRDEIRRERAEFDAARRWTPEGLEELRERLSHGLSKKDSECPARWLVELYDALDKQEWPAVDAITHLALPWPSSLRAGAERIARDAGRWGAGDVAVARDLMQALAEPALEGWDEILRKRDRLRARAHRLAAWLALRCLDKPDREAARAHMEAAVKLSRDAAPMLAQKAGFHLHIREYDSAATDAQAAIERTGRGVHGYLELGIWAEVTGEFGPADELYREGFARMPVYDIARLNQRASLVAPPGRLLARAAEHIAKSGRAAEALELADQAVAAGVRGAETHPHASVQALRSRLLEELGSPPHAQAAATALRAGKLYRWNGELDLAVEQFVRALELDESLAQAGWLSADALTAKSLPRGKVLPDMDVLARAREAWERQYKQAPPSGETAWAYVTRAVIADLERQRPDGKREHGIWTAISFVEAALVHDDTDAQAWGYTAKYLRYAQLYFLAMEAAETGAHLSPADRHVLAEQLILKAGHAPDIETAQIADRLVSFYGHDPIVGAVKALLAIRAGDCEKALRLLDLPLADGNDPLWYLDMCGLCHAAIGATDAARRDYAEMLHRNEANNAPAIDGTDKCRLAIAALMSGSRATAGSWLAQAADDPTTPSRERALAAAWTSVADDDLEAARLSIAEAARAATSLIQLDDIDRDLPLRLRLLGRDPKKDAEPLAAELATARRELTAGSRFGNADTEINAALAALENAPDDAVASLKRQALLAVASRRHLRAGDLEAAARGYEQLRKSFHAEAHVATFALGRVLRLLSSRCAQAGDVEGTKDAQGRLMELKAVSPAVSARAVAKALEAAGDLDGARAHLRDHLDDATSDSGREAMYRRLGRLALDAGEIAAARSDLEKALTLARRSNSQARAGRLELMLATAAVLAGDEREILQRIRSACAAWSTGEGDELEAVRDAFRRLLERAEERGYIRPSGSASTIANRWTELADPARTSRHADTASGEDPGD